MPDIVYLHGFASGPSSKKAQFFRERLERLGMALEIPDLADGNFESLTVSGQLRLVERTAAGRPVRLVGSSLGGYLAALYAARHPEVERLLLLAPAFGFARRWAAALGDEGLSRWKQTGYLTVYHYGEKRDRQVGYQLIEDGLNWEDSPDFRQPALIFHGTRDTVVAYEWSKEFAAGRPNVQLRLLDSDHELIDVLEAIWEQSRDFLAGAP